MTRTLGETEAARNGWIESLETRMTQLRQTVDGSQWLMSQRNSDGRNPDLRVFESELMLP